MRKKLNISNDELFLDLFRNKITMVEKPRFNTIDAISEDIKNNINGDIVECGSWRGGMSIYLANTFYDRKIWVCDSFCGFQPLNNAMYRYDKHDRHDENFDRDHPHAIHGGMSIIANIEDVKNNFNKYGFNDENIIFLEGYVKDTLNPLNCNIENISLLRIDVDSYSATLEVLTYLYDKVSVGGYIIFDDSALYECQDAIQEFMRQRDMNIVLTYPSGVKGINIDENGGFFKKI